MRILTSMLLLTAACLQAQPVKLTVPDCDAKSSVMGLYDEANALSTATGADVRVRLVVGVPFDGKTIEDWLAYMLASCRSWQAADNPRALKNNLIIIAAAPDMRKTVTSYGDQWKPVLDSQWPRIQSQIMNPRFREKDYTGGLKAGMAEIGRLIQLSQQPPIDRSVPSAPTDLSGLWRVMLWALAAGVSILVIIVLVRRESKRKADESERIGAQQEACIAQQEASGLVVMGMGYEFEGNASAKATYDSIVASYSQLGMGATDPNRDDLTASQYRAIADKYRETAKGIKTVMNTVKGYKPSRKQASDTSKPSPVVHIPTKRKSEPEPTPTTVVEHHYHESTPSVLIFEERTSMYDRVEPTPPAPTPAPVYQPPSYSSSPEPSGGSTDWGSSSDSSSSSSSDFGSSDSGSSGGSTDW